MVADLELLARIPPSYGICWDMMSLMLRRILLRIDPILRMPTTASRPSIDVIAPMCSVMPSMRMPIYTLLTAGTSEESE
jgi:hypothetical protein